MGTGVGSTGYCVVELRFLLEGYSFSERRRFIPEVVQILPVCANHGPRVSTMFRNLT